MGMGKVFADFPEIIRSGATAAVTGHTPEELFAALDQSPLGANERPDRRVHALASQLAAERLGTIPAFLLGSGKELIQGVGSLASGGSFFGEKGFDPGDMRANEVGIISRRR